VDEDAGDARVGRITAIVVALLLLAAALGLLVAVVAAALLLAAVTAALVAAVAPAAVAGELGDEDATSCRERRRDSPPVRGEPAEAVDEDERRPVAAGAEPDTAAAPLLEVLPFDPFGIHRRPAYSS